MTQPSPYRVNVDPRAKQMDGGGVPYRMGADFLLPQRWGRACGFCDRTLDHSVDTETGYALAARGEEYRHVLGTFESRTEKNSQYLDRMKQWGQWGQVLFLIPLKNPVFMKIWEVKNHQPGPENRL